MTWGCKMPKTKKPSKQTAAEAGREYIQDQHPGGATLRRGKPHGLFARRSERAPWSTTAPPAGDHAAPGVGTRASRGAPAPCGAHRATGWGGAAWPPLGLDTRRRMEEGRTCQGWSGRRGRERGERFRVGYVSCNRKFFFSARLSRHPRFLHARSRRRLKSSPPRRAPPAAHAPRRRVL